MSLKDDRKKLADIVRSTNRLTVENLLQRMEIDRLRSQICDLQWDKFAIKALVMRGNEWSDESLFDQLKSDFQSRSHVTTRRPSKKP